MNSCPFVVKSGKESSSSRDATVRAGLARCGGSSAPRSMLSSSVGEAEQIYRGGTRERSGSRRRIISLRNC